MKSWIKRYWILSLFLLVGAVPAGLNYSGFCWEQKRWLSDDEKIRLMVTEENSIGFIKGRDSSETKKIPYKDVDEFLKKNPDCCKIGYKNTGEHSQNGYYWPFTFWDYIFFTNGDVVSLYYNENYTDKNDTYNSHKILSLYAVSNCGKNLN